MSPDPAWTCPHCGAAGIKWADKKRCAVYGTPCKCGNCGGFSREARQQRTVTSLLLYGVYVLLFALAGTIVDLVLDGRQDGLLLIGLPILAGLWLLIRYALMRHSAISVPLAPIFPSPRWERLKDIVGTTVGILMLGFVALCLIAKVLRL